MDRPPKVITDGNGKVIYEGPSYRKANRIWAKMLGKSMEGWKRDPMGQVTSWAREEYRRGMGGR